MPLEKTHLKIGIVLVQVLLLFVLTGMLLSDFNEFSPMMVWFLFTTLSILGYIIEQEAIIFCHIMSQFMGIVIYVVWTGFHFARVLDATNWTKAVSLVLNNTPVFIALLLYCYCCIEFLKEVIHEFPDDYRLFKGPEYKAVMVMTISVLAIQNVAMMCVAVHWIMHFVLNHTFRSVEPIVFVYLTISLLGFANYQKHIMAVHNWVNRLSLIVYCFWAGNSYQRIVADFATRDKCVPYDVTIEFFLKHFIIFSALLGYTLLCRALVKTVSQPAGNTAETLVDV